jgi:predicted SAM-dependent methyltransferase
MQEVVKQLKSFPLYLLARELKQKAYLTIRKFRHVDRNIVANYLSQNNVRKLHIGCGSHILPGWLNSDYFTRSSDILHLDATRPFPFNDDEFDYIFSEHMIEHISYSQGFLMLTECFRVLKRNGQIRISTPDLSFLVDLHKENKSSGPPILL